MDLEKILTELRTERNRLDEAILAIERISHGSAKRRGRRPKWLAHAQEKAGEPADRPADRKTPSATGKISNKLDG
jgi:hypothetical protein